MKFLHVVCLVIFCAIGMAAHAATREELIKQRQDMTHSLVRKDSTFSKSIQEILPNGVFRISAEEFSSQAKFSSFIAGKSNAAEVKQTLGSPAGESQEKDGRFVYSYGVPKGIIAYVFKADGTLDASYGYSLPW